MKYTPQQYEVAKKFREFYYGEINPKNALEEGWWERMSEDTWDRWTDLYVTGKDFQPQEEPAGDRARKLTKEFFFPKVKKYVEFYFNDGLAFWESLHDENKDAWIGTYLRAEHGSQREQVAFRKTEEFFKEKKMKYTPEQYERGKKYYEFYFEHTIPDSYDLDGYVRCYLNAPNIGSAAEKEAFRKTEEFFAAKENKVKVSTPSNYTFVSTDKDVDLLRIVREARDGSPFILIEKKNRTSNKTDTFLLVHEKVLNNPTLSNLRLYGERVENNWGVYSLGHFPGKDLEGTGYQGHFVNGDRNVSNLRAEIEAVIKALNPKDTKTTVTVW